MVLAAVDKVLLNPWASRFGNATAIGSALALAGRLLSGADAFLIAAIALALIAIALWSFTALAKRAERKRAKQQPRRLRRRPRVPDKYAYLRAGPSLAELVAERRQKRKRETFIEGQVEKGYQLIPDALTQPSWDQVVAWRDETVAGLGRTEARRFAKADTGASTYAEGVQKRIDYLEGLLDQVRGRDA